jgi:alcohol dehydrogenase
LENFYHSIGLATTLDGLGIHDDRLAEMADKATNSDETKLGNFVKLGRSDVLNIYKLAL